MPTCPNGHQSGADDWCEVCGHRMAGAVPPPPPPPSGGYGFPPPRAEGRPASSPNPELCPQCRTPREGGAPFCEECRWNFLTNTATSYTPASPPGGGSRQPRFQPPSASYGGGDGYEYQGSRPSQVNRPAEPIPPFDNEPSGPTPFGAARGGAPAPPQTSGGPSAFGARPGGQQQGFGGGQGGPGGAPSGGQQRPSMFERERPGQGGAQGGPPPFGGARDQSGPGGQGGQGGQGGGQPPFGRAPSGPGGQGGAQGGPGAFDRNPSGMSGTSGTQGGGTQPPYGGPSNQAPSAFGGAPSRQTPGYPPQETGHPNNGGPSFGGGADDWVISPPSSPSQNGPSGGYGYPQPPSGYQQGPATWTATIGPDREYFMAMMQRSGPEAAGLNLPAYSPEQQRPLTGNQLTIGRRRHSTGDTPDIDLSVPPEDPGVSHQHAVLVQQPDGTWAVVDQNSTNGTTVNGGDEPIQPFVPVPLQDGDRVHVGAWTTITIRRD
ncbi:FHA domain-containing protein [Streptomyces sp. NPDC004549]|uniref:FHA domain-containing protein n=1 Tax=Streptomyces sp. NPDC004549 TaxID=3154283 RepID=UPI0033BABC59